MLRRVALVRTDVSEELSASLVFLRSVCRLLVTASFVPSSSILVTMMKGALSSSESRFLQESHGVTTQKTLVHSSTYSRFRVPSGPFFYFLSFKS
jgi:hypothetical protein